MRLFGGHKIEKATHRGLAWVAALFNPVDSDTDHRSTHHRQVEGGSAVADAAAIFSSDHIEAQVQARFDAPIAAVRLQHLLSGERRTWAGAKEIFGFDVIGGTFLTVHTTGQPGRLLHKREISGFGGGRERNQAARFGAIAVEFAELRNGGFGVRGKKRATDPGRVVARFHRRPFDCP